MKIKVLICFTLLMPHILLAQETVTETYCFPNTSTAQEAQHSAKYLMITTDQIAAKGDCFTLFTSESRRELIQKYLLHNYPQMKVSYSSAERNAEETCKLTVEKNKVLQSTKSTAGLERQVYGQISHTSSNEKEISQISALSGAPFEIMVDRQKIQGKCRYITPSRYEIEFSLQFIPRPLVPPTPPGTVVVINHLPPPEIQKGVNLTTSVQINRGERIELGNIVKDLNAKANSVSIDPNIHHEKTQGTSEEKIYLSLQ